MELKQLILHTQRPLVIKNRSNCSLLSWTLEDWTKTLGNDLLEFRCGKNRFTKVPQWDSTCTVKRSNFGDFLGKSSPDEWWYFDYKHLCQWFKNNANLREQIDWSELGFPELKADDSTIWIGSKGAHTPCHQDTYGTNMVLQLLGKKLWLLWPPDAPDLKPTRIPFEESSVFSKLNFFSPHFEAFGGCFKVVLEPGDVLVVPHKWWHYVENLECSISLNCWLPGSRDDFERVKESIATILVRQFDPHSLIDVSDALKIIEAFKSEEAFESEEAKNVGAFKSEEENIFPLEWMSKSEFNEFLKSQRRRFEGKSFDSGQSEGGGLTDLLDAILSDEVLDLVAKKLKF